MGLRCPGLLGEPFGLVITNGYDFLMGYVYTSQRAITDISFSMMLVSRCPTLKTLLSLLVKE